MYDSNDLAMQKVLKDIRHTNKTPREEMEEIAVGAIKTKLTVTLSRLLGTNALPSMSPVARIINFVAKKLPSGRDTYNVQNFIVNQLEKGTPLNAKVLADDLRKFQSIASMSDKEVDDIVEDLVTVSQQTDISARRAKLKSQLDELKKSTKEHKLAMAEADNKVKFAKVAVDDSIEAGEGVREAKRALEQAKRDQRVVQAKSGKEINLNEELSQKLSNSELPSVPKQGMNTILKKIDPTNHGKVIVPEKPSDLLKPVEVVQPKPQTVKPKVEEPKVDKPLEMVKPKPEVAKMGQEDIEKLRDAQRGLREKNGHKIFGKNLMEEFHSGDKKKVFSEFLAQKLRDGEVSKEDIMKYYHANASLGTITELTDGAISGVTGTAKRLLKSLKDSGIELDDFKQYMKDLSYTEHKSTIQDYSRNSHGLATSKKMKDFLNSAPTNYHNSPVHRGTRMTEEELAGIKEGEVISNDNVLSTSKSAREAMKFKRGKVVGKKPVAIFIKNANGHDISSVSVDPSEAEVVLNSGKAFKVIKKVDDSTVLLTLQEIPVDKTVRARKVRL
jgi:DNA-binding transcriptional MerR regulator